MKHSLNSAKGGRGVASIAWRLSFAIMSINAPPFWMSVSSLVLQESRLKICQQFCQQIVDKIVDRKCETVFLVENVGLEMPQRPGV